MTETEAQIVDYLHRIETKLDTIMRDIAEMRRDRELFNQQRRLLKR